MAAVVPAGKVDIQDRPADINDAGDINTINAINDNLRVYQNQEVIVFRTRPSFLTVGSRYLAAAFVSILAAGVIGYFGLPLMFLLPVILFSFAFPLVRHIQRNRILYTLTNNKIEIEYGIISKTVRNIPLRNVQDVTVSARLSERLFRVGDVVIDSAADAGKIRMRQIPNPRRQAELILENMSRWR